MRFRHNKHPNITDSEASAAAAMPPSSESLRSLASKAEQVWSVVQARARADHKSVLFGFETSFDANNQAHILKSEGGRAIRVSVFRDDKGTWTIQDERFRPSNEAVDGVDFSTVRDATTFPIAEGAATIAETDICRRMGPGWDNLEIVEVAAVEVGGTMSARTTEQLAQGMDQILGLQNQAA